MREFIVVADEAILTDIPLLSRLLNAAFFLSHDIRKNVTLRILLWNRRVLISFVGAKLRHLHVDEQSMSGILRKVARTALLPPLRPTSVHYGILVESSSWLKICGEKYYFVSPRGQWLSSAIKQCDNLRFVLSEKVDICRGERMHYVRVTVLPKPVDTTLAILNIELDRLCGMFTA